PQPTAIRHPQIECDTCTRFVIFRDAESTLKTLMPPGRATHSELPAAARAPTSAPNSAGIGVSWTTAFVAGSTRASFFASCSVTQTPPCTIAIAPGESSEIIAATEPAAGSGDAPFDAATA